MERGRFPFTNPSNAVISWRPKERPAGESLGEVLDMAHAHIRSFRAKRGLPVAGIAAEADCGIEPDMLRGPIKRQRQSSRNLDVGMILP